MADTVTRLKSLDLQASIDTPKRPYKRRVFNDIEWQYLNSLPTAELVSRVNWGKRLIALLRHPAILNITPKEAETRSSNLEFQIDAINHIISERKQNDG